MTRSLLSRIQLAMLAPSKAEQAQHYTKQYQLLLLQETAGTVCASLRYHNMYYCGLRKLLSKMGRGHQDCGHTHHQHQLLHPDHQQSDLLVHCNVC